MVGVKKLTLTATREGFGKGIVELATANPKVVALCGDLSESTYVHLFAKEFPERFIQMGVQEENMVGMAAGLALSGLKPFAASYAVFNPGNSLGPLRVLCYSKLPVTIVGGHTGFSADADGATHQALEDIAIMRTLPHMIVVVPADAHQAQQATIALGKHSGPAYLRTSKHPVTTHTEGHSFHLGKAQQLTKGSDITLIACGSMVSQAMVAQEELREQEIKARVINMHTIKPLDTDIINKAVEETDGIITIEEHQVAGGLGSAVAEYLAQHHTEHPPFKMLGVQDRFGQSGTVEELWDEYGLSVDDILDAAEELLGE